MKGELNVIAQYLVDFEQLNAKYIVQVENGKI